MVIVSLNHYILNFVLIIYKKEGEESDYEDMDEETKKGLIKEQKRIKKMVENDAKRIKEYQQKLKKESIKTFKDRPDQINQVFVIFSNRNSIKIKWNAPECNNCPIKLYNIYLSGNCNKNIGETDFKFQGINHAFTLIATYNDLEICEYLIENLDENSAYFV